MSSRQQARLALLALQLSIAHAHALVDDAPAVVPQQKVLIVGTTMLPGAGTPLNQVPGNVQVLDASAVTTRRAATLAQALDEGVGSVNVIMDRASPEEPLLADGLATSGALDMMVVDDNADAADTLATLLQTLGHRVEVHTDPRAALDRLKLGLPPS